jgi:hypothetical protein
MPSEPVPIQGKFPPPDFPNLFADGVSSLAPSPQIVKFILARVEPHLQAQNETLVQPFAQVVMPTAGFLHTAFFFQNAVQNMLADGTVTQQMIDMAKTAAGAQKS